MCHADMSAYFSEGFALIVEFFDEEGVFVGVGSIASSSYLYAEGA